jgi:hypothetical protein
MSKSPRTSTVSTPKAKGVRRISSKTNVLGDKAVILPIPFLKAERNVGQGSAGLVWAPSAMLAAGAVFLSCCHCVRATASGLARPSISEWVGVRRIDGPLTQKLYRNGCMGGEVKALLR